MAASDKSETITDTLTHPPQPPKTTITQNTGGGKSTLLLALLGEVVPLAGGCELSAATSAGKVAYVSQRPWILNATLRVRGLVVFCTVVYHVGRRPPPLAPTHKRTILIPPQKRRTSPSASPLTHNGTGQSWRPARWGPICG